MSALSFPAPSGVSGENEWAVDLLEQLGVTPTSMAAPDVLFISAQEQHEGDMPGTAAYAAEHNPLGLKGSFPGVPQSSTGVDEFPTVASGLAATAAALSPSGPNAPYARALRDPSASLSSLESGLASSAWEGLPAGSAANQAYAQTTYDMAASVNGHPASDQSAQGGTVPVSSPFGSLSLGGSIMKDVLTGIAAVAGLALIGAGLVKASSPDGKLPSGSKLAEAIAA